MKMKNKTKLILALVVALTIVSCKGKEKETTTVDTAKTETSVSTKAKETKGKLSKEQENALVFGAVLTTRNNMPFDDLKAAEYKDASIQVLQSAWDVTDTATAKAALDSLMTEGHRADVDPILAELRTPEAATENSEEFQAYEDVKKNLIDGYGYTAEQIDGIKTASAWDYDRLVNVARFSYSAGYITEQEMWDYINKAVTQAKNDYNSWEEYFAGVMLGRTIAYGQPFADSKTQADKLLKNADSVYKTHSFK
jgi:uncharacterized lipoprotein YehR (DUF1307 family)